MEYLPTLSPKVIQNNPNVGKYSSTMDPQGLLHRQVFPLQRPYWAITSAESAA